MVPGVRDTFERLALGLIEGVLHGVVGQAAGVLKDDDSYRRFVIDPAWDIMPLPVRLIGRERLRWDTILLAVRDEVFETRGTTIHLRVDARSRIAVVAGRILGAEPAAAAPAPLAAPSSPPPAAEPAPAVGIDLGTTFSVVAHLDSAGRPWTIPNAEGDPTTPSAVLFDGGSVVVGKEAIKAAATEPDRVAQFAKRDMGSAVYARAINGEHLPPEFIQSLVLEKLRRDAEAKLGPVREAVITVPAYFNEPRRKATQDAGRLAGIEVLDIINEPTAAALAYGVQQGFLSAKGEARRDETILVYDLGGGTFDVTVMRIVGDQYRTLATGGDVHLGGLDWDRRVVDHIAEAFRARHHGNDPRTHPAGLQRLLREAEDAKRALSARNKVTIHLEHAGHAVAVPLARDEFEAMTADLLDRTRFTALQVLRDAGLSPTDLSRVLLVGGSTRMPMVGAMLRRELGIEPDRSLAADEAVAHGAAIYAGLLQAAGKVHGGMAVRNVNSHALGVLAIETATGRPRVTTMIPRNTPLPAAKKCRFQTRRDHQRSVAVEVVEGGDASGNGATAIGRCVVRDLPPGLPAGSAVVVVFHYAEDGRLTVEARVPAAHLESSLTIERADGLTEDRLAAWDRKHRPLRLES